MGMTNIHQQIEIIRNNIQYNFTIYAHKIANKSGEGSFQSGVVFVILLILYFRFADNSIGFDFDQNFWCI